MINDKKTSSAKIYTGTQSETWRRLAILASLFKGTVILCFIYLAKWSTLQGPNPLLVYWWLSTNIPLISILFFWHTNQVFLLLSAVSIFDLVIGNGNLIYLSLLTWNVWCFRDIFFRGPVISINARSKVDFAIFVYL